MASFIVRTPISEVQCEAIKKRFIRTHKSMSQKNDNTEYIDPITAKLNSILNEQTTLNFVISQKANCEITKKELLLLLDIENENIERAGWLNDELVHFLTNNVTKDLRIKTFGSNFFTSFTGRNAANPYYSYDTFIKGFRKKFTEDNIFLFEEWLLPVSMGGHWVLVYVNFNKNIISLVDSYKRLPLNREFIIKAVKDFISDHFTYLKSKRIIESKKESPNLKEINFEVAQQNDGKNCGVFCVYFARCFQAHKFNKLENLEVSLTTLRETYAKEIILDSLKGENTVVDNENKNSDKEDDLVQDKFGVFVSHDLIENSAQKNVADEDVTKEDSNTHGEYFSQQLPQNNEALSPANSAKEIKTKTAKDNNKGSKKAQIDEENVTTHAEQLPQNNDASLEITDFFSKHYFFNNEVLKEDFIEFDIWREDEKLYADDNTEAFEDSDIKSKLDASLRIHKITVHGKIEELINEFKQNILPDYDIYEKIVPNLEEKIRAKSSSYSIVTKSFIIPCFEILDISNAVLNLLHEKKDKVDFDMDEKRRRENKSKSDPLNENSSDSGDSFSKVGDYFDKPLKKMKEENYINKFKFYEAVCLMYQKAFPQLNIIECFDDCFQPKDPHVFLVGLSMAPTCEICCEKFQKVNESWLKRLQKKKKDSNILSKMLERNEN